MDESRKIRNNETGIQFKRRQRREHPFEWFFGGLFCIIFFLFFAAILMAVYTHPVQP